MDVNLPNASEGGALHDTRPAYLNSKIDFENF